jgi:hypothetical protein
MSVKLAAPVILCLLPAAAALSAHPATTAGAPAAATASVTVAAVGDMACDPESSKFNKGAGTSIACAETRVSNRLLSDSAVTAVLGLGDYQYDCGDAADYAVSYNPTWGRLDPIMRPAVGNHEYKTGVDVFGDACPTSNRTASNYFSHFGAAAHPGTMGHFSFDLGGWHLIALNANCAKSGVGGCGAGSPETAWLRSDLAATTQPCILAFWHQPLYQGLSKGVDNAYQSWWSALIAAHADLVLNGHIHDYQRFPRMDASAYPSAGGLIQYVIGTGGEAQVAVASNTSPKPAYWRKDFGYLRLTLDAGGWTSVFVAANGTQYDRFSGGCH